jgi:hypothetical protein
MVGRLLQREGSLVKQLVKNMAVVKVTKGSITMVTMAQASVKYEVVIQNVIDHIKTNIKQRWLIITESQQRLKNILKECDVVIEISWF